MARVVSAVGLLFTVGEAADASGFLAPASGNATVNKNTERDTSNELAASWDCSSWCSYSPSSTWEWIPSCSGCGGRPAATLMCENWCQYSPSSSWQSIPSCEGCVGKIAKTQCLCSNWCENVPAASQSSVMDCCGCSSVVPTSCAGWCVHSPSSSWQNVPACQGCTGQQTCTCSSWCNNLPSGSWETVPDCCACGSSGAVGQHTLPPAPAAVGPAPAASPTPGPPWARIAACSANSACNVEGLNGDCCPTSDGSMLGCCSQR